MASRKKFKHSPRRTPEREAERIAADQADMEAWLAKHGGPRKFPPDATSAKRRRGRPKQVKIV